VAVAKRVACGVGSVVRVIPPTDADFVRLYPRRNDAESINRNLDDTLWLRRAHSVGHERQLLNLLATRSWSTASHSTADDTPPPSLPEPPPLPNIPGFGAPARMIRDRRGLAEGDRGTLLHVSKPR